MSESTTNSGRPDRKEKGAPVFLIFLTVVLSLALVYIIYTYFEQKKKMTEIETVLTQEKDSLAGELRKMVHGYDTLKSNNDSLNAKLQKERTRIIKLLEINASNTQLIRTYKAEIGTMRNIMKSYIVQIDSLNTRNKILVAENKDIREQITSVQKTNVELSKVKEELTNKVEIASVIQAKNITMVALNKSRKETTRLDRIEKLKICFTLRENKLAKAGEKIVYLRVIRPDSLAIATSPDNLFDYNGAKLIFTASRQGEYLNQDLDMCIYVDKSNDFVVGNYKAELFLEGSLIGSTTFMITKK